MARRPADFPARTRRLIAERAGYRCSMPECRRQTLGPGAGPHDVACIGVACHIYSAAPGGPRGSGDLTREQLQAMSNGIWLCADHARLIDTSQGRSYSAPLLRGWRQLHEAFLTHEMRGLVPPCTLITEVNVRQGPEALKVRPVALSALNIITGPNSSGKTTLLDLLARAGRDSRFTERPWSGDLVADIHWFDPRPHLLQLHLGDGGAEILHDRRHIPGPSAPYRTVAVSPPIRPASGPDYWAGLLGLDHHAFLSLLQDVPRCVRGEVSQVDIAEGIPLVSLHSLPTPIRLDENASRGGSTIVLLEAAIALAQMHSLTGPVLLLIDDFGDFLHPALTWKLLSILTSASHGFQTILVTHHLLPPEIRRDWTVTAVGADDHEILIETAPWPDQQRHRVDPDRSR